MAGRRRHKPCTPQLTEVELELMTILWAHGGGTVHDVRTALPADRALAYTSVSTMLRILEQKGIVASEKRGQAHVYVPRLGRAEYEASALRRFLHTVFADTPRALVTRLLDEDHLTQDDLVQIHRLLAARLGPDGTTDAEVDRGREKGDSAC